MMIDPHDEYIFSVGELNESVRQLLEKNFTQIWLSGEISNFMQPASGHMYFSLKDTNAQIRCAFFRGRQRSLSFLPENGQQVLVCGKLSLYPERGDYQLIVEDMRVSGEGDLKAQFEALKKKLEAEGLFAQARKKALPLMIRKLGVITSATGAALQDVLSVLRRRWPLMEVVVYDSMVQGNEAPSQLIRALRCADQSDCDALLMTRGGGSLEDLWAFNDEQLARAIAGAQLPIVSAVGHEVDFSISDFVADVRAPTPSAAAELLSLDQAEIRQGLATYEDKCERLIRMRLERLQEKVTHLSKRLVHPADRLNTQAQHLDHLNIRLAQALERRVQTAQQQLERLSLRLRPALQQRLALDKERFGRLAERLNTMSPLATLSRGYALAQKAGGEVITNVEQIDLDDSLTVSLATGKLKTIVIEKLNA